MQMEEVAVSKCIEYYNVMNSLQTAKSMLQWIMHICEGISLQLTANSFCSEGYFFVFFALIFTYLLQAQISLFKRFSRKFYIQKIHCKFTLQTANANLHFYLSHQAQLHTAITPTTPLGGRCSCSAVLHCFSFRISPRHISV